MNEYTSTINDNPLLQFIIQPAYRVYRHLLLLLIGVLIIFLAAPFSGRHFAPNVDLYVKAGAMVFFISLLYVNMYWLVRKLLFRSHYGYYFLSVLVLTIIGYFFFIVMGVFLKPYIIMHEESSSNEWQRLIRFMFIFIVFIAASTAVKLFQRWVVDNQRINELERVSMQSELDILKSQINPHFLFNTLNNVNVLVQRDADKASQVLMKLSDMLRYQLYDSARQKVLLTADIHFLTDFLNLEKIRRDHFDFLVSKEGDISGVQVPPFLFITFVENAVKHNMDAENHSYIHSYFTVQGEQLRFVCVNSKPAVPAARNSTGGLGLVNVRRRLELLYPGRHSLEIQDKTDIYSVTLTIRL